MESKKHRQTSERIAKKYGTKYNKGKGPDVKTSRIAVEVETITTVKDGMRQLQGHKGSVYLAGADSDSTKAALKVTEGTTVGVMNSRGKIVKRSTRKKTQ